MSENWQVGDLALCVKMVPWVRQYCDGSRIPSDGPKCGEILIVRKVQEGAISPLSLHFDEYPVGRYSTGWAAHNFRKVTPPAADEFDREVIELMTGGKVPSHA